MIDLIVPLDKSNPFTEEHLKLHVEHFQKQDTQSFLRNSIQSNYRVTHHVFYHEVLSITN